MPPTLQPTTTLLQERYLSLDVLRGLTIALMVVVNTPGSWNHIYGPFTHADWHGFTLTDLVFPTFLFVVGNAMGFSMKKLEKAGTEIFLKKIFKRTAVIFLIGWGLNAFPFFEFTESGQISMINWGEVRLFGVLQRIALCYLLASVILYYWGKLGSILFSVVALLGYWAVMYFYGESGDPYSLTGNAALKLDLWVVGAKNLYTGEGIPFDPEGILSTIPAVVNVIAGYWASKLIQKVGNNTKTIKVIVITGIVFILLSLVWHLSFPINKKIWTSSYVLLTVGYDLILIGVLIYIIEVWKKKKWTYFFVVFGRNPLILYILSGILISILGIIPMGDQSLSGYIYEQGFLRWLSFKDASLMFALVYTATIWLIGFWMDQKKIYIKV
ncbi:acyltransferase family protein [Rhodonellum sp.]|uniref:acyltransferase family protein n=1 Tax=Rhodonellum sp. TaxID=2231180 RepID=UPI002727BAA2|nr:heparan-alpha-glucosaminide N-acetyltransferase domain-containing protein [Rhodonellum sp.]MDO9554860.1 heparan-alpha-glucosaminide N-acetyltransferase domain-containing protein [Rhodonellum sp.]